MERSSLSSVILFLSRKVVSFKLSEDMAMMNSFVLSHSVIHADLETLMQS